VPSFTRFGAGRCGAIFIREHERSEHPDGLERNTRKRALLKRFIAVPLFGAIIFLLTLLGPMTAQNASQVTTTRPVEDAKALLRAGRYAEALPVLQGAASGGNAEGELYLGFMYQKGWGVPQDYVQARQWYEKSAGSGNSEAVNELGIFYENGWGVIQDYAQARHYFE